MSLWNKPPAKAEPKVERIDLGAVRAEKELAAATEQQEISMKQRELAAVLPPPPPAPLAATLASRASFGLPPTDLCARWDEDLGETRRAVDNAEAEAIEAAQAWEELQPGGAGFSRVLEADRAWTLRHLDGNRPPPLDAGPLAEHLATGSHRAYIGARRAQVTADRAAARMRVLAKTDGVRRRLDEKTDDLAAEIIRLFEKATADEARRLYEDAIELCGPWREVSALYVWCTNPDVPYRRRINTMPEEAAGAEFRAATALGETRYEIPDTMVMARTPRQVIRSEGPKWGPDGAPPR